MAVTRVEPRLLAPVEAAAFLRCSLSSVWRLVRANRLPTVRLGARLTRFAQADLEAYVAACRVDPVALLQGRRR